LIATFGELQLLRKNEYMSSEYNGYGVFFSADKVAVPTIPKEQNRHIGPLINSCSVELGENNNCKLVTTMSGNVPSVHVRATRTIRAHEMLRVSYGAGYSRALRKIRADQKKFMHAVLSVKRPTFSHKYVCPHCLKPYTIKQKPLHMGCKKQKQIN
jgi:hypothetical protein